ncbi:hypothetical protein [Nocardioides sp. LML1-1-1.1]|uniref:hypothetical protein n=1 Tax=Nocardioides sp. LML1-1-1.1 TaxID=3135248 RepID=UPI0034163FB7
MASPRRPAPARGRTTRGPLDPGVYWRRRVFVLGVAFALVFGIARVLTGGSDASSDEPVAEQAGARVQPSRTVTAGATPATGSPTGSPTGAAGATAPATPTLAAPQGPCPAADVVVTPSVPAPAVAGSDVTLRLSLQTKTAEACTWQVSPATVIVKISDGSRQLWTTQQCSAAVPPTTVVVRRAVATVVDLTWTSTRQSDAGCTRRAGWVTSGDYTIAAAALGGEPASAEFVLVKPTAPTTTATAKPTTKTTTKATPTGKATKQPTKQPTKAVN